MILNVRVNNYMVYSNEVELSLKADMRIKRFASNVYSENGFNVLKSVCIYGANNSGKTCFIRAINSIRNILLGFAAEVPPNLYSKSKKCSFGVAFLEGGRCFDYSFDYDSEAIGGIKKGFTYESLKELTVDQYGNLLEKELFTRDIINDIYRFGGDEALSNALSIVSSDNILIYTINTAKYPIVETYKKILRSFAGKIEVLDMNDIPIQKTISVLKNDESIKEKTVELIKQADLDITDYTYTKAGSAEPNIFFDGPQNTPREVVLQATALIQDMSRLVSVHKGISVPSMIFDSTGTKKIIAAASFIIDAIENGKILVIDELDSSLHFKLTRAIVALFNNDLNKKAQLIFTAHDVTLLDCKKLFRKEQIWFASKDKDGEYLYSLADFTANGDKVRSESDIAEKYISGLLGAIPEPDLISVLLKDAIIGGDGA